MHTTREFQDAIAVVVGANGSIGSAIGRALADLGAVVSAWDVEFSSDISSTWVIEHVDVKDEHSIAMATRRTIEQLGQPRFLVNAAGVVRESPLVEMTLDDWNAVLATNVTGTFLTMKHLAPEMQRGGAIVNVGSVAASVGTSTTAAYTASKGAVHSLTMAAAQELATIGLRVNAVSPGWVDGGFTSRVLGPEDSVERDAANQSHLTGRMARPEEVADSVCHLLSDRASFVVGSIFVVDGGFSIKR